MPNAVKSKPATASQRSAGAIQQASEYLELEDAKRLGAALTIAAAETLRTYPQLADMVRRVYEELQPPKKTTSGNRGKKAPEVELIPVKSMEGQFRDPSAPLDPYFLLELYGPKQLPLALDRYTATRLREGVKTVQARHPGTKPAGTAKQALIDYIVTVLLPLQL
ncbi:MAG TPA: hypothetical protein VF812_04115 [Ktedonobacterales bacterium]